MKYIMALDQGTTSSRCIIFDKSGSTAGSAQQEFTQIYPHPGWVEHDPMEILSSQLSSAREAMSTSGIAPVDIAAIGIANQRETTIIWDKKTGRPVYNAIVWQCRRTSGIIDEMFTPSLSETVRQHTGLLPDAYFSASKIAWILDNVPDARERARRGELLFGTVESWIIWNLTGGVHVTDFTNASRTMLFNIHTLSWDDEILALFDIPRQMLPKPVPSSGIYGYASENTPFAGVPICGAAGDQQAALFGQGCFCPGDMKVTYGTGAFLLMNTREKPVFSMHGLLTTLAASETPEPRYALEGSVFVAGALVKWLRDELCLIKSAGETQALAESVSDTCGAYVVPAFTGLGAPHWNQDARGTVVGLTRGCTRAHFVRASLEAIAYQTGDVISAMRKDAAQLFGEPDAEAGSGEKSGRLSPQSDRSGAIRADGGASRNDFLMQFQSDISCERIIRPKNVETTALGAAYLAGLAVGYWKDTDEIKSMMGVEREFAPGMSEKDRKEKLAGWKRAVECALMWAGE